MVIILEDESVDVDFQLLLVSIFIDKRLALVSVEVVKVGAVLHKNYVPLFEKIQEVWISN